MQSAWEREAAPGGGVIFPHWLRLIIWSIERHVGVCLQQLFPNQSGESHRMSKCG